MELSAENFSVTMESTNAAFARNWQDVKTSEVV
jgi:hypothetical protein